MTVRRRCRARLLDADVVRGRRRAHVVDGARLLPAVVAAARANKRFGSDHVTIIRVCRVSRRRSAFSRRQQHHHVERRHVCLLSSTASCSQSQAHAAHR